MRTTFVMTQDEIDGAVGGGYTCPVARCLQRYGYTNTMVGTDGRVYLNDSKAPTHHSADVCRFADDWDHDRAVTPITFTLDIA